MRIDRDRFLVTALALSAACVVGCAKRRQPPPRVAPPSAYGYPQPYGQPPPYGAQPCSSPPGQPPSPACEGMPPPSPAYE